MKSLKFAGYWAAVFFLVPLFGWVGYAQTPPKDVEIIEIRNYLLKPGQRDNYVERFETYLIDTLNVYGNYILGQYKVKGAPDNFVWIRGFENMPARKTAMESFFSSAHWEKHKNIPGDLLVGYTNVHLLKPLYLTEELNINEKKFPTDWFGNPKGVALVDFYVANGMRDQFIEFVNKKYDSLVRAVGVKDISYWVSETSPNNYPNLPVFQDKNLLVSITFFKDEQEYEEMMEKIKTNMDEEMLFTFGRLVTTKTSWVLYPTKRSFKAEAPRKGPHRS